MYWKSHWTKNSLICCWEFWICLQADFVRLCNCGCCRLGSSHFSHWRFVRHWERSSLLTLCLSCIICRVEVHVYSLTFDLEFLSLLGCKLCQKKCLEEELWDIVFKHWQMQMVTFAQAKIKLLKKVSNLSIWIDSKSTVWDSSCSIHW